MGSRATAVALCPRCRGQILPDQPRASFISDMWRAPAKGMTKKPDPQAERIKRRKAARNALRAITRGEPSRVSEAVTFYLKTTHSPPPPEDCAECIVLQKGLRARFLGYDPTTNLAFAQILK